MAQLRQLTLKNARVAVKSSALECKKPRDAGLFYYINTEWIGFRTARTHRMNNQLIPLPSCQTWYTDPANLNEWYQ